MEFLLTSAGIRNTSIHAALADLLGKPITESRVLCIPTAIYPFPGGPSMAYKFISGSTANPMCELGWKSLGVLELTALPGIKKEYWIAAVQEADALLVQGGDVWYLCRWMRESGLADLLPSLRVLQKIFLAHIESWKNVASQLSVSKRFANARGQEIEDLLLKSNQSPGSS